MRSLPGFSYDEAFSRNLGWVTAAEQARLKGSRVCIAGLGGVGGVYLLTLARLGVGAFSIAEFDTYALANFNRQGGGHAVGAEPAEDRAHARDGARHQPATRRAHFRPGPERRQPRRISG